jgi:hypothetical protein
MSGTARTNACRWTLVTGFALAIWLVPLLLVLLSRGPRRAPPPAGGGPPLPAQAPGPLILYAAAWPTRQAVDLAEIQGVAAETDNILAPQGIAADLALALRQAGIASETQRLDERFALAAPLAHRDIVLVYPLRHGAPPWPVMRFVDHALEPALARQDPGLAGLTIHDVAIAEDAAAPAAAQAALAASLGYYHVAYQAGPALDESLTSIVVYKRLQALAATMQAQPGTASAARAPTAAGAAAPAAGSPHE